MKAEQRGKLLFLKLFSNLLVFSFSVKERWKSRREEVCF